MNTIISNWRNKQIKLHIDEPGLAKNDCAVLAVAMLHEGLGVWNIEDLRLYQYGAATPHFCVRAEKYWSTWTAPTLSLATRAREIIRQRFPEPVESDGLTLQWCTFDGLVRGKTPADMGVGKHMQNPAPLLHTKKEVATILTGIAKFWEESDISELDPNVRALASAVKIENPWRQAGESELRFLMMETGKATEARMPSKMRR
jgi:hypothetical protein